MRLRITPPAAEDIEEAESWYAGQRADLGERFEAALDRTFERLLENPHAYQVLYRGGRRAPMGGSFSLPPRLLPARREDLFVVAVAHSSRHPRRSRLGRFEPEG